MGKRAFGLVLTALFIGQAVAAFSQTVINPRTVEFDPSADHNAVSPDGAALVLRYELAIYAAGGTTALYSANLAKPAPDPDGKIRVDFAPLLPKWPLPDGTYEARVGAVGSSGEGQSNVSNPFSFAACSFGVLPLALSMGPLGGAASVAVTTNAGCTWTAASGAPWIAVSTATGTGTSTVVLTIVANSIPAVRTGTVTVAGTTITVTQEAAACTYSLSGSGQTVAAGGGTGSVSVTAAAGCSWAAASDATWLTVVPATGVGSTTVSFTATANTATAVRAGTLTIAGRTFTVTQSAPSCTYSLASTSLRVGYAGTVSQVGVTCGTGCPWTSSSILSWVTVTPAAAGDPGPASVTVAANGSTSPRTGSVTIAGIAFTVTQDGKPRPQPPSGLKVVPKKKK